MADNEQSKITKAQYESVIKKMDIMQETMDRRFEEWSQDRKTITNLEVRLKIVEAKIEGARDDIADSQKKTLDKIDEHLQPIPDVISNQVKDSIAEVKKKRWFQLFRRG
jgi:hypothetical protein